MSLNYTVGDWTIVSNETDTISTPKTLSIPDMDFAHDFSVVGESAKEAQLINTSGATLEPVERLKFGRDKVNDIYRSLDVLKPNQLPSPVGIRLLAENTEMLTASNSTTGAELTVPIRVWTCIETSTHNTVTGQALLWALLRHVGTLFKTGTVTDAMLISMARGDLDPTK